jgi:heme/copper-type cytochrome/quinol oxidase subunit 3
LAAETLFDAEIKKRGDDSAIKKSLSQGPPPFFAEPPFDSGGNGRGEGSRPPMGNVFLAMLLFIGADVMFFAGLIGAFVVFRFGATDWPPLGQPRLPVAVTGVNTIILLISGLMMLGTWRHLDDWNRRRISNGLNLTALLGAIFLLVQGYEWAKLVGFGLTMQSSVYGAIFYTLIGCHALHVLGAVIGLLIVMMKLQRNQFTARKHNGIKLAGMYWFLVVGLWPVLYGLVYLK